MEKIDLYNPKEASACFFRTTIKEPYKKSLLQITEKCNLRCNHCFLSAEYEGNQMPYESITNMVIPYFKKNNIIKVTLTGGEPLVHEKIYDIIEAFDQNKISVTVCSNGSLLDATIIKRIKKHENVKFNISLDGFSNASHGGFRNSPIPSLFDMVKQNIMFLSENNLLNGILVTPNKFSSIEEYVELCKFAKSIHAKYVLMNPLSQYGRGEMSKNLAFSQQELNELRNRTKDFIDDMFDIVYIRFPNEHKPLSKCNYGKVLYVFTDGNIAICPYMVFGANNMESKYKPEDFYLGNILEKPENLDKLLKNYQLPRKESIRINCSKECSRGCIAAKIGEGRYIEECDFELCPQK
ncbi:radical SAM protein [Clostridium sp. KNHs205]|uniref:radical SAM protein n=1 Tax=Clostridium sp. KNHs205 TaxID=1449050 RepID=UPI00068F5053|nr:radical SAM protein [Clostridium sp. KNHs205]